MKRWLSEHLGLLSVIPLYLLFYCYSEYLYDGGDLRGPLMTLLDSAGVSAAYVYRAVVIELVNYLSIVFVAALLDRHAAVTTIILLAGLPLCMSVYNNGGSLPTLTVLALLLLLTFVVTGYLFIHRIKGRVLVR